MELATFVLTALSVIQGVDKRTDDKEKRVGIDAGPAITYMTDCNAVLFWVSNHFKNAFIGGLRTMIKDQERFDFENPRPAMWKELESN